MREAKVPKNDFFIRDDGTVRLRRGTITKGYRHLTGYTHMKGHHVHRLVAQAFVHNPRPDIFTVVDHIDHIRTHNHYTNLRWVSRKFNQTNQLGRCVKVHHRQMGTRYTAYATGIKTKTFGDEDEALAYVKEQKRLRMERIYQEELKSEPKFRHVGTQCTLIA